VIHNDHPHVVVRRTASIKFGILCLRRLKVAGTFEYYDQQVPRLGCNRIIVTVHKQEENWAVVAHCIPSYFLLSRIDKVMRILLLPPDALKNNSLLRKFKSDTISATKRHWQPTLNTSALALHCAHPNTTCRSHMHDPVPLFLRLKKA
jgi:hypothetical protein